MGCNLEINTKATTQKRPAHSQKNGKNALENYTYIMNHLLFGQKVTLETHYILQCIWGLHDVIPGHHIRSASCHVCRRNPGVVLRNTIAG